MTKTTKCVAVVGAWLTLCGVLWIQAGAGYYSGWALSVAAVHGSLCAVIGGAFSRPIIGLLGGIGALYGVVACALHLHG